MNTIKLLLFSLLILLLSCAAKQSDESVVEIETTMGKIVVRLYDDTPEHKKNFLKLANNKYYRDILFHRVIKNFMIQAGDPNSKKAKAGEPLGAGGPKQTIPAEILYPKYYHKRGALAAARQGDALNPNKESSGSQFYIVWGKTYLDEELNAAEEQRATATQRKIFKQLMQENSEAFNAYRQDGNEISMLMLQNDLQKQSIEEAEKLPQFGFSDEQREAYKTIGGSPFLDGEYTVFGEVIEGLDIVEKIQLVATDANNRPTEDIRIIKTTVLK